MKKRVLCAAFVLAAPAWAQELPDGPVDTYFLQGSVAGKLDSCSLVFTSVVRDWATLKGARVIVNGSLAFRRTDGERIFLSGKLGTRLFPDGKAWEAPAHFFFATGNRSTAGIGKIAASDTDGYKLLIAPMNDEVVKFMGEMGEKGEFTVGFNRRPGGGDVLAKVKINIALKKDANGNAQIVQDNEAATQFFGCMRKLLQ